MTVPKGLSICAVRSGMAPVVDEPPAPPSIMKYTSARAIRPLAVRLYVMSPPRSWGHSDGGWTRLVTGGRDRPRRARNAGTIDQHNGIDARNPSSRLSWVGPAPPHCGSGMTRLAGALPGLCCDVRIQSTSRVSAVWLSARQGWTWTLAPSRRVGFAPELGSGGRSS